MRKVEGRLRPGHWNHLPRTRRFWWRAVEFSIFIAAESPTVLSNTRARHMASLLDAEGLDVVGEAADASQLLEMVEYERPDVAITDIRMPPTYTVEGVRAAAELRETHPQMGVLLLSQYIEVEQVTALLGRSAKGFGYLLKERVSDIDEFIDALRAPFLSNKTAKQGREGRGLPEHDSRDSDAKSSVREIPTRAVGRSSQKEVRGRKPSHDPAPFQR